MEYRAIIALLFISAAVAQRWQNTAVDGRMGPILQGRTLSYQGATYQVNCLPLGPVPTPPMTAAATTAMLPPQAGHVTDDIVVTRLDSFRWEVRSRVMTSESTMVNSVSLCCVVGQVCQPVPLTDNTWSPSPGPPEMTPGITGLPPPGRPEMLENARQVEAMALYQLLQNQQDRRLAWNSNQPPQSVASRGSSSWGQPAVGIEGQPLEISQRSITGLPSHSALVRPPMNAWQSQTSSTTSTNQLLPEVDSRRLMETMQCNVVLTLQIDVCLQPFRLSLQQFFNPRFVYPALAVCQASQPVGQCILQLDKICGVGDTVFKTRRILNSFLQSMSMVCLQIQARRPLRPDNGPTQVLSVVQLAPSTNIPTSNNDISQITSQPSGETRTTAQNQPLTSNDVSPQPSQSPAGPQMTNSQRVLAAEQCQTLLAPRLDQCLSGYQLTMQQFFNPQYMQKAQLACQASPQVSECIITLDKVCGDGEAILTTRQIITSLLQMMSAVCQKLGETAGGQQTPMPESIQVSGEEQNQPLTSNDVSPKPSQSPAGPQMTNSQGVVAAEQCQTLLAPRLDKCLAGYQLTMEQFFNPQNIHKAQLVCQSSQPIGQCLMKLDKVCGEGQAILNTQQIITSLIQMMSLVCQKIQGGQQQQTSITEPGQVSGEPQMTAQNQPLTSNGLPQEPSQSAAGPQMTNSQGVVTAEQCQTLLAPRLDQCLSGYQLTMEQFFNPQNLQKAQLVCQASQPVTQCIISLDKTCGEEQAVVTTQRILGSVLQMMSAVCQQIQGGRTNRQQPPGQVMQGPLQAQETAPQLPGQDLPQTSDTTLTGRDQPQTPDTTLTDRDQLQPSMNSAQMADLESCKNVLIPRVSGCLQESQLTLDQFFNPEFSQKAQVVCQASQGTGQCIMGLDKVCGDRGRMVLTARSLINSILRTMSMVCQQTQETGPDDMSLRHRHQPGFKSGRVSSNLRSQNLQSDDGTDSDNEALSEASVGHDSASPTRQDLLISGYPVWLVVTLALVLLVVLILSVAVTCMCCVRCRKQKSVTFKSDIEKVPERVENIYTIGLMRPSFNTHQNKDGHVLPTADFPNQSENADIQKSWCDVTPDKKESIKSDVERI